MHSLQIIDEFTRQSATFNVSPVMHAAETLQSLLDVLPTTADQRWLEVACGTGVIARALSPRVQAVHGVDITQAMLEVAEEETRKASLSNVTFSLADVNRLPFSDAHFDGVVTRFSLHHIPLPGRCVAEMARVVRPGGWVAIGDHVTSEDQEVAAWHQEVERLRDPSHWSCLTPAKIRALGHRVGLELRSERRIPFSLDFEEWLTRGSGGDAARELLALALADAPSAPSGQTWDVGGVPQESSSLRGGDIAKSHDPNGSSTGGNEAFRVVGDPNRPPRLHLTYSLTLWQHP